MKTTTRAKERAPQRRPRAEAAHPNVTVEAIEKGELWLEHDGRFLNANADAPLFDAVFSAHVELLDRTKWPLYHRATFLALAVENGWVRVVEDAPADQHITALADLHHKESAA